MQIKQTVSIILILICLFSLTACEKQTAYNIDIQSPVVVSKSETTLKDGTFVLINIEMLEGKYFYDALGGGLYGGNWEGKYQIRVYKDENEYNTPLFLGPIFLDDTETMNFGNNFSLMFDDYNDDGSPDFTLGQWGSSNGNYYNIFSINQSGTVSRLELSHQLFVSSHEFSITLEKTTPTSFTYSFYDNSKAEHIQRNFKWVNGSFTYESANIFANGQ